MIIRIDNCRICPFSAWADWWEKTIPFNCDYYNREGIKFDFTEIQKPEFCDLIIIKTEENHEQKPDENI